MLPPNVVDDQFPPVPPMEVARWHPASDDMLPRLADVLWDALPTNPTIAPGVAGLPRLSADHQAALGHWALAALTADATTDLGHETLTTLSAAEDSRVAPDVVARAAWHLQRTAPDRSRARQALVRVLIARLDAVPSADRAVLAAALHRAPIDQRTVLEASGNTPAVWTAVIRHPACPEILVSVAQDLDALSAREVRLALAETGHAQVLVQLIRYAPVSEIPAYLSRLLHVAPDHAIALMPTLPADRRAAFTPQLALALLVTGTSAQRLAAISVLADLPMEDLPEPSPVAA